MGVTRRFTVEKRGIGRPDYTPAVLPGKPIIIETEEKWEVLVTQRACDGNPVPPRSAVAIDAYTVPSNKKLHIGGGMVSCDKSVIQKVVLTKTPGWIGDRYFDLSDALVFTDVATNIIDPGHTITIWLFNNDTDYRDFSVTLTGTLERISK